jgi:hypothetical protein
MEPVRANYFWRLTLIKNKTCLYAIAGLGNKGDAGNISKATSVSF